MTSPPRWQDLLTDSTQAIFVLNHNRRVRFVNRVWEELTGLTLQDVRGLSCRRRKLGPDSEPWEWILTPLAPGSDAAAGKVMQVRRRVQRPGRAPVWWDVTIVPIAGSETPQGYIGLITPRQPADLAAGVPLPEKLQNLPQRERDRHRLDAVVSQHPAMQRVLEQVRLAAQSRTAALFIGPAGCGKRWLARALHEQSAEREKPFACLDANLLPWPILADLLQQRRVNWGTIYLRHPEVMPRDGQERLHDWLQRHDSTESRVLAGVLDPSRLLPELLYRLGTLTIDTPALVDRPLDLAGFVEAFAAKPLSEEAWTILRTHHWPGNLRELRTVLKGIQSEGPKIDGSDLPFYLRATPREPMKLLPLDATLEQVERRMIAVAMREAKGNRTDAAQLLGIWRARLTRRIEALGMDQAPE